MKTLAKGNIKSNSYFLTWDPPMIHNPTVDGIKNLITWSFMLLKLESSILILHTHTDRAKG